MPAPYELWRCHVSRNARGITSSPLTRLAFERLLVLTQREPFVSRTIPHLAAGDGSSPMLFLRLCRYSRSFPQASFPLSPRLSPRVQVSPSVLPRRDVRVKYPDRSFTSTRRDSIDDSANVRDAARSIVVPFSSPVFGRRTLHSRLAEKR